MFYKIMNLELFTLIFLFIISLIDVRFKQIPSVIMTAGIFTFAMLNIANFPFALLLTILGVLLLEARFMDGIADLKCTSILGFMVSSFSQFFIIAVVLMVWGVVYQVIAKYIIRERIETAFLPVFFLSYLTYLLIVM